MYYIHKDYPGSYYCITDENGQLALLNDREEQVYSFDPRSRTNLSCGKINLQD